MHCLAAFWNNNIMLQVGFSSVGNYLFPLHKRRRLQGKDLLHLHGGKCRTPGLQIRGQISVLDRADEETAGSFLHPSLGTVHLSGEDCPQRGRSETSLFLLRIVSWSLFHIFPFRRYYDKTSLIDHYSRMQRALLLVCNGKSVYMIQSSHRFGLCFVAKFVWMQFGSVGCLWLS